MSATPFPPKKEKVKDKVKAFMSEVAVEAIKGMPEAEKTRIGKDVVEEERKEIAYDRRQKRLTRWMGIGMIIGVGIGVPVTFSVVWSIFVFPLWFELYRVGLGLIPLASIGMVNRDSDIWRRQRQRLQSIGGWDTIQDAMKDYGAVPTTPAQSTGRLPKAVWKQCPTCEHNRQKFKDVGITVDPEATYTEVPMRDDGTTEPTECPKCHTMIMPWVRPRPILQMTTEALFHGA